MSNEMPMQLATVSLLILSTNYHQNVNHQSVLCRIDCSHCHHWLFVSFCWVVSSTRLHPRHVLSLQCTLVYHVGTQSHILQRIRRIWKSVWLIEQIHSHIRDSSLPCSAHRSIQSHSLNWKLNTPGSVTQSSGTLRIRTASLECCFMTQLRLAQRSIQLHPLSWLENALGLSTTICNWM